jgi:hypothetical protein
MDRGDSSVHHAICRLASLRVASAGHWRRWYSDSCVFFGVSLLIFLLLLSWQRARRHWLRSRRPVLSPARPPPPSPLPFPVLLLPPPLLPLRVVVRQSGQTLHQHHPWHPFRLLRLHQPNRNPNHRLVRPCGPAPWRCSRPWLLLLRLPVSAAAEGEPVFDQRPYHRSCLRRSRLRRALPDRLVAQ